jgi:hypothetical protein
MMAITWKYTCRRWTPVIDGKPSHLYIAGSRDTQYKVCATTTWLNKSGQERVTSSEHARFADLDEAKEFVRRALERAKTVPMPKLRNPESKRSN